jgi:hypothetical protein
MYGPASSERPHFEITIARPLLALQDFVSIYSRAVIRKMGQPDLIHNLSKIYQL